MWSLVIVLALCLTVSVHTQSLRDLCETWKGTKGICRHYLNCPTAAEGVQANGPLEICNYEGIYPIVCCEFDNSAVSPPRIMTKPANCITNTETDFITTCLQDIFAGGTNAKLREFPHMALLGYGEPNNVQWVCGGSLISNEFILTAAHCLNTNLLGKLRYIRLGEFDYSTTTDDTDPQDFTVRSTHPHPNYTRSSFYHDIALVRLDRPVRISDYVKPACLGLTKNLTNLTPVAMGWGTTSYGGRLATILQAGQLSVISNEMCRLIYGKTPSHLMGIVDEIQVCADGAGLRDSCEGDSGGPLQIMNYRNRCQEIVGVTSFGKHCPDQAGVYTRVYPYTSWIKAVVRSIELFDD